jgi:hypothetical protein
MVEPPSGAKGLNGLSARRGGSRIRIKYVPISDRRRAHALHTEMPEYVSHYKPYINNLTLAGCPTGGNLD